MLWGCQTPGEPPGDDDAAGLLDSTRISYEEDARPQENILGERCCRDLDFGRIQRKASLLHGALPWPARVTQPGSAPGTSCLAARGCWKGMVQAILLNRHGSRGESPASIIPASSRLIPRGNGYFWASPRAIKSPVGAGTAVPQQEVMLPSPSRHKQLE